MLSGGPVIFPWEIFPIPVDHNLQSTNVNALVSGPMIYSAINANALVGQ